MPIKKVVEIYHRLHFRGCYKKFHFGWNEVKPVWSVFYNSLNDTPRHETHGECHFLILTDKNCISGHKIWFAHCLKLIHTRSRVKSSEGKCQWSVYFLKSNKIDHYIMGHFIPTTTKRELFLVVGRNFISGFMWRTCNKTGWGSFISVLLRRVEVLILIDREKRNQWNLKDEQRNLRGSHWEVSCDNFIYSKLYNFTLKINDCLIKNQFNSSKGESNRSE